MQEKGEVSLVRTWIVDLSKDEVIPENLAAKECIGNRDLQKNEKIKENPWRRHQGFFFSDSIVRLL